MFLHQPGSDSRAFTTSEMEIRPMGIFARQTLVYFGLRAQANFRPPEHSAPDPLRAVRLFFLQPRSHPPFRRERLRMAISIFD